MDLMLLLFLVPGTQQVLIFAKSMTINVMPMDILEIYTLQKMDTSNMEGKRG